MRVSLTLLLAGGLAMTAACGPAQKADAPAEAGDTAAGEPIAAPAEKPKLATNESLTRITCADFLDTARIASTQPADDAALAAQDELANGLTWLHGYLFASKGGKIEPLSQDWMAATAERVFDACSKAENPAETNLFEVAVS